MDYIGPEMSLAEKLEWAARQYSVAVDYLLDALVEAGEENPRIRRALSFLVDTINEEWTPTDS